MSVGTKISALIGVKKLSDLRFDTQQVIEDKIAARMANRKLRNVYTAPWGALPLYSVRLCVGGKQWELGRTANRTSAVRFADMAIAYFWKYRKRRLMLAASDGDLNISVEQANRDLASNPEGRGLLEFLEASLISKGVLHPIHAAAPGEYDYAVRRRELLRSAALICAEISEAKKHFETVEGKHLQAEHYRMLEEQWGIFERQLRNADRVALTV